MEKIAGNKILILPTLITLISLTALFTVHAQNGWTTLPDGRQILLDNGKALFYSYTQENGKLKSLQMEDPEEVVKVIVTLKDKPLAFYKGKKALRKTSLAAVQLQLKAVHSTVKNKIGNITQQLYVKTNFQYKYKIRREYYTAINGMVIECNRGMIKHIQGLSEVKNVQLDRKVKADLTQSVHQIRADIVQDSLGYSGDSVVVGEIDTGIDYNNTALGGGFGAAFRVIGGYDFANDDNDPMDDHGHGTHVAGIIGANGGDSLRGVVPHVKFLAVKVLSADGSGTMSDVIAGIEYCMDPDGNPTTDDAVDIISMSLGGQPIDNSPEELAVDNATQAGILSVIAAGNSGNSLFFERFGSPYQTISSPGTAVTALTVGACDSSDSMASFSSKGPDPIHFAIKPEVVAPGVSILSAVLHNGTASWSGTSMATPHVTGVAALLKQQHRDWSPEQLKAAIVNSAKAIGESPYIQGNGRVDALHAATLGMTVQPGLLSFGLVDLSLNVWKDTVEFKIRNLRPYSQNFNLEIHGSFPAGVEVTLSQTGFSLASQQETLVTAIVSVPRSVPILNTDPYAYTGNIICRSDSDTMRIPMGFVKSNILIIDCDIQPYTLMLYGKNLSKTAIISVTPGVTKYTFTTGVGVYNLFAIEQDTQATTTIYYCILRDSINITGLNYITLNHNEAVFSAFPNLDQVRDIDNNPVNGLDSSKITFTITIKPASNSATYLVFPDWIQKNAKFKISPMDSSVITLEQNLFSVQGDRILSLTKLSRGVITQSDLTLLSGLENLTDMNLKFTYENPVPPKRIVPYLEVNLHEFSATGGAFGGTNKYPLQNLRLAHLMVNKNPLEFNPMKYTSMSGALYEFTEKPYLWSKVISSEFRIHENGDIVFFERKPYRPDLSEIFNVNTLISGDTLNVEKQINTNIFLPEFQFQYKYNSELHISSATAYEPFVTDRGVINSNGMHEVGFFEDSLFGHPNFSAQIFARNRPLQSMNNRDYKYTVTKNMDRYHVLADAPRYNLLYQSGQTTIDYEFIITEPDYLFFFLPSLDFFQILGDSKLAQWLQPEQDGKVRLVVFDPKQNVDSVGIYLLKNDGTEIGLTTTKSSSKEYFAVIPKNIPAGFMDVIARVHNAEGNTFQLTVSPAFYYGADMNGIQYDSRLRMSSYILNNVDAVQFSIGDTLKYTLSYINYGNSTAKNITAHFPQTDCFNPVGNTTVTMDSIQAGDTCSIPLALVFLGKKQTDDMQSYYTPSITWTSGGKSYLRNHKLLVSFKEDGSGIAGQNNNLPQEYLLYNNYPNPFNPATTISYSLPENAKVKIEIFNILGQKVATLVDDAKHAGSYELMWNAGNLSSGVYFCKLKADGKKTFEKTQKLILMK